MQHVSALYHPHLQQQLLNIFSPFYNNINRTLWQQNIDCLIDLLLQSIFMPQSLIELNRFIIKIFALFTGNENDSLGFSIARYFHNKIMLRLALWFQNKIVI